MRIRYWSLDVCSSDLAIIRAHRQFQALSGWQRVEQLLRQPARFRSEQENVAVAKRAVIVALCTARRERQPSRLWPRGAQGIERCLHADIRHFVIIEHGEFDQRLVDAKAERFAQMQRRTQFGAKAEYIAGVLREFRL